MRPHRCANRVWILVVLALGACDEPPREPAGSAQAGRTLDFVLHGKPIRIAVHDCEVFAVDAKGERARVVTTDFYPMFSVCQREEVSASDDFIRVELGRTALGAGGCCATSGSWRTRDGRAWERRVEGRWLTPEQEQAARERAGSTRAKGPDK